MSTTSPTVNYAWTLPTVSGDTDAWGDELNAILGDTVTGVDAVIKAVSTVANAALPKAGGTMTGNLDSLTNTMKHVDLGTTNAAALNFALANSFSFTPTAAYAPVVSNVPATSSRVVPLLLKVTNGGAFAPTWPASFSFPAGSIPSLTTSGNDIMAFVSYDAGTTFRFLGISKNV